MKSAFNKLRPNFWSRLTPSSDGDYFFVELEDAHRTWHPGDTVHGNVILVLYKPQRISSVDLTFAGNVVVKSALVKGKGSRSVLFEQKLRLHGASTGSTTVGNLSGQANSQTNSTSNSQANSQTNSNRNSHVSVRTGNRNNYGQESSQEHGQESEEPSISTSPPVTDPDTTNATSTTNATTDTNTNNANASTAISPDTLNPSLPSDLSRTATRQSSDGSIWRSVGSSGGPSADLMMNNSVTSTEPVLSSRMSMHTTNSHLSQLSRESHVTTASRESHMSRDSNTSTSSTSEELEIGEHRFAFILEIPQKGLYNSLEFERGSISYVVTAVAKRHGPLPALHAKRVLQLVCPVDVARLPPPKPSTLSVEIQKRKKQQGIITTTLEVGRGGYLRGESFPVKISIQHVKCVKCLRGLVVTLCRFSKVTCNDDEPQSFRKDLSQTVSPLYTDPVTFSSTVSTTLRIPPDVFPTTKGHGLVSFNYCVEVVIDLAGKWDLEEDRTGFLHTDRLKRNKGVVSLWTEVIIGTDRRRYRSDSHATANPHSASHNHGSPGHVNFGHVPSPSGSGSNHGNGPAGGGGGGGYGQASQSSSPGNQSNYSYHGTNHVTSHMSTSSTSNNNHNNHNHVTAGLSEKQLMKLREEALLPSEPASTSSPSLDAFPSAPEYVIDGEGGPSEGPSAPSAPSEPSGPSHHVAGSASRDKHENELFRLQGLSSDPYAHEDHVPQYKEKEKAPEEEAAIRLHELASVPPIEGELEEVGASGSAPSAPVMNGHEAEGFFDASSELSESTSRAPPPPPHVHGHVHGHSHSSTGTIVSGSAPSAAAPDTASAPSAPPVITHGFTGPIGPGVAEPGTSGTASTTVDSLNESVSSSATPASTLPDTNKSLSDSDDIYS